MAENGMGVRLGEAGDMIVRGAIHFGVICPEASGHLNPAMALARELQRRGHRVTFYLRPIGCATVQQAGFSCRAFGSAEFPPQVSRAAYRRLGELSGIFALLESLRMLRRLIRVLLRDVPELVREDGVEALLVDQTLLAGEAVAEIAGLPYAVIYTSVPTEAEPGIPPYCTSWRFRTDRLAILRNQMGYRLVGPLVRSTNYKISQYRFRQILAAPTRRVIPGSPPARICQSPVEFDYPRQHLPENYHFTGPLTDASVRPAIAFPFEKLDGRPLVYASLGTMQNRQRYLFERIASACAPLNVQLVISLGGGCEPKELGDLAGSPIVVGFAPQLELMKRAALCITHAGMNTTMECLAEGVPIVAIPITNDQPGVAARIAWTGCGEFLPPRKLTARRLRRVVRGVLEEPRYRQAAQRMRAAIGRARGVGRAADIVEAMACSFLSQKGAGPWGTAGMPVALQELKSRFSARSGSSNGDRPAQSLPFVSVIIPVYNDLDRLASCLEALERQTYWKDLYEVLVIDNGSDLPIETTVNQYAHARASHEARPGSYAARNKGLALARGEVVAFTDSDCLPGTDWLAKGVEALLGNVDGGLVAGGIELFPADPNRPTTAELYDCTRGLRQKEYVKIHGFAATANLFTFKCVFDAIGPFDADLKSGGDRDWGRRAVAQGFRFEFAQAASVAHPARHTLRQIYSKVARVMGGVHTNRKKKKGTAPAPASLKLRILILRYELGMIRRDPRLTSRHDKLRVAAVHLFVESVRSFERTRLRLGGRPRR